jgi:tRNA 2-thiouridine synthesizing protein A
MITTTVNKELDARGLTCPLPILKAKKALSDMHSGEVLKVLATDPGSVRDLQAFARQTGNDLIEQRVESIDNQDVYVHLLRRR